MKVIIVKPFTNPYTANIKGDLRSMQELVGGYIEAIYPFDNPEIALVCNEEGKLEGLHLSLIATQAYVILSAEISFSAMHRRTAKNLNHSPTS